MPPPKIDICSKCKIRKKHIGKSGRKQQYCYECMTELAKKFQEDYKKKKITEKEGKEKMARFFGKDSEIANKEREIEELEREVAEKRQALPQKRYEDEPDERELPPMPNPSNPEGKIQVVEREITLGLINDKINFIIGELHKLTK